VELSEAVVAHRHLMCMRGARFAHDRSTKKAQYITDSQVALSTRVFVAISTESATDSRREAQDLRKYPRISRDVGLVWSIGITCIRIVTYTLVVSDPRVRHAIAPCFVQFKVSFLYNCVCRSECTLFGRKDILLCLYIKAQVLYSCELGLSIETE